MFIPLGNDQSTLVQLLLLYFIELITLIYLWRKYKKSLVYVLFILLFYPAIFAFIGKSVQNYYNIFVLLLTLWISYKGKVFTFVKKEDKIITTFFVLFSLFFSISALINQESWTIVLSQYSRYLIAYCLWFIVRREGILSPHNNAIISQFTYDVVLMQIVITIGKIFIFGGRQIESIVGSVSHIGGAAGTIIPILGFVALWFYRLGVFKQKDWIFVIGLMLIGLMTGKRAVWFIMPFVIASFMIYIPNLKRNGKLGVALIFITVAFYFGVRLTPTLNREHKSWGSFDMEYVFNYAQQYQFGNNNRINENEAQGRGGATFLLLAKWSSNDLFTAKDWLGMGLSKMYGTDYDEFEEMDTGINWKGAASGVFQTYVATGYVGIITTILVFFTMLFQIKRKRIRWALLSIVIWEYFMYTGIIFRTPAFMFLIIYFIHYSNILVHYTKTMVRNSPIILHQ